jgi:hypothetical protein
VPAQAALLLLPLAFPPREPARRAPSDYDHKAPSSSFPFTAFFLFRESLKPLKLCLHTGRREKENFRRRKGSNYDALGSYLRDEPWKNNGKNRRLLRISIFAVYRES